MGPFASTGLLTAFGQISLSGRDISGYLDHYYPKLGDANPLCFFSKAD